MAIPAASPAATARAQPWFPGDDSTPDPGTPPVEGELSFRDLLDVINPLQHIPLLSSLYRAITGDEIGTAARVAGATLYGGPLGLLGAGIGMAVEEAIGGDPVVLVAEALTGTGEAPTDTVMLAAAGDGPPWPAERATAAAPATPPQAAPDRDMPRPDSVLPDLPDLPVQLLPLARREFAPEPAAGPGAGPAAAARPPPVLSAAESAPRPTLADAHNLSLALLEERERPAGPGPAGAGVPAWFPTVMEEALARYAATAKRDGEDRHTE